jgi:HEAT repeat protein
MSAPSLRDFPEKKTTPALLFVQFVVLPLAVVLFCVALGGLFVWLTAERKDAQDYLNALRAAPPGNRNLQAAQLLGYIQESKRWQGIFDFSQRIVADADKIAIEHPRLAVEVADIFRASRDFDPKTRRYLALVLGILGDQRAIPALREGLHDGDAETVKNCAWALGQLRDEESVPRFLELARHDEAAVRMVTVYVLGSFDGPHVNTALQAALNDPNELVTWNAAFALAMRDDDSGRNVLLRLLDKEFVDSFADVTPENRTKYRKTAVVLLARLDKTDAIPVLEKVSTRDRDLQVRNVAIQELKKLREP